MCGGNLFELSIQVVVLEAYDGDFQTQTCCEFEVFADVHFVLRI